MFNAIPVRLYAQCGWVIMVSRDFEAELLDGGETLRMFDKDREISLSSMMARRHDGQPMSHDEVLRAFPPRELTGAHYTQEAGDIRGRAVWTEVPNDNGASSYVLFALLVAGITGKLARVTIVSPRREDAAWAVETWKTVRLGQLPEGIVVSGGA